MSSGTLVVAVGIVAKVVVTDGLEVVAICAASQSDATARRIPSSAYIMCCFLLHRTCR